MSLDLNNDKSTLDQIVACVAGQQAITWANVDQVMWHLGRSGL